MEDSLANFNPKLTWENGIEMIVEKKMENEDWDGNILLPISTYPELLSIAKYVCLQFINSN